MKITESRIILMEDPLERLQAFSSVTLEGQFVVRDLKVIKGVGGTFVGMPSRKLTDRCPKCRTKNHLRARFCNQCGIKLAENRAQCNANGKPKLHADIAHPINPYCRELITNAVLEAYEVEKELASHPGYQRLCYDEGEYDEGYHEVG